MSWPVTHESDTWFSRRWAIFMPPHKSGVIEARPFRSEKERDVWVAANPNMRQAVGKRHPAVKALRAHWARVAAEERT